MRPATMQRPCHLLADGKPGVATRLRVEGDRDLPALDGLKGATDTLRRRWWPIIASPIVTTKPILKRDCDRHDWRPAARADLSGVEAFAAQRMCNRQLAACVCMAPSMPHRAQGRGRAALVYLCLAALAVEGDGLGEHGLPLVHGGVDALVHPSRERVCHLGHQPSATLREQLLIRLADPACVGRLVQA